MKTTMTGLKHTAFLVGVAAMAASFSARAQTVINWYTLDAGGGAAGSAGGYVINGTAGQTDVGPSVIASSTYRIIPGFWALENLGPALGRPVLTIARSGANVIISWPSPSSGFVLQQANTLPGAWVNTPGAVSDNGFVRSLTVPHDQIGRFYRLRSP